MKDYRNYLTNSGCGNNIVEPGEQCEVSGDNCLSNCTCAPNTVPSVPLSRNCLPTKQANLSLIVPCSNDTNHYTCIPGLTSQFLACHNGYLSFEQCLPGLFCDTSFIQAPNFTFFNPCSVAPFQSEFF